MLTSSYILNMQKLFLNWGSQHICMTKQSCKYAVKYATFSVGTVRVRRVAFSATNLIYGYCKWAQPSELCFCRSITEGQNISGNKSQESPSLVIRPQVDSLKYRSDMTTQNTCGSGEWCVFMWYQTTFELPKHVVVPTYFQHRFSFIFSNPTLFWTCLCLFFVLLC